MTSLWPGRLGSRIDYISAPPSEDWRASFPRRLVVLGSTGSIGRNTLSVVEEGRGKLKITGLAAGRNVELLARQATYFRPSVLAVLDGGSANSLKALLPADYSPLVLTGVEGYATLASLPDADLVVSAQAGSAGLPGTLAAAMAGKVIALANKESLVLAGSLLRKICAHTGASILPLDSEHYAIFQCMAGREQGVAKLVLTASGGPFRNLSTEEMRKVTVKDALKHPNWSMGRKITIDSATMMNKGLEFIEACQLFGVSPDDVEVLIHPQSIIHSMIILDDNSMLAQLAVPDMRGPIAACLFWPHSSGPILPAPDLASLGKLTFEEVDRARFPAVDFAREALISSSGLAGESMINPLCLIMNAANEMAVELFLDGACHFHEIPALVKGAMSALDVSSWLTSRDYLEDNKEIPELVSAIWESLRELDSRSRNFVTSCVRYRSAWPAG